LGSDELNARVENALKNNLNILVARAHLERAKQLTEVVSGTASPQLDLETSIGRNRIGAAELGPYYRQTPAFSAYNSGIVGAFDLDLFGRIKRTVERGVAMEEVAAAELDAVMLDVSAEIVNQQIRSASAFSKMQIIDRLLSLERARLTRMQQALVDGAGTIDQIDRQARIISDIESQIPALLQQRAMAEDALAVTSGSLPAGWSIHVLNLDSLNLPAGLPLTIPSVLASRRPDIQAAEAYLHAATAKVGIATSNRYPHVELRASLSEEGVFSGPAGLAWNAIGGLTEPLIDGGTLRGEQKVAEAELSAAQENYQMVIVKAFGQVADCLQALQHDSATTLAKDTALALATSSVDRIEQAYRAGGASELEYLTAQSEQQIRSYQQVDARAQQLTDSALLILATTGAITDIR
jgi:NodT family efflux transporter outer membrane factor (OMF) lipoprotein